MRRLGTFKCLLSVSRVNVVPVRASVRYSPENLTLNVPSMSHRGGRSLADDKQAVERHITFREFIGENDRRLTHDSVAELRSLLLENFSGDRRFEQRFLTECAALGFFELGSSYLDYLARNDMLHSNVLVQGLSCVAQLPNLDDARPLAQLVLSRAESVGLNAMPPVLSNPIRAALLALSGDFEAALPLIKETHSTTIVRVTGTWDKLAKETVIRCAAAEGRLDKVLSLLDDAVMTDQVHSSVVSTICESTPESSVSLLNAYVEYLARTKTFLNIHVTDKIVDMLKRSPHLDVTPTFVHQSHCNCCGQKFLPVRSLTDSQLVQLRRAFLKHVMRGNNVYATSDPKELKHFLLFLSRETPFDLVVDGLNLLYNGMHNQRMSFKWQALFEKLNFAQQKYDFKRILLLGRRRDFGRYYKRMAHKIEKLATVYLVDRTSQDDLFILYAALLSNSWVVSGDQFQAHLQALQQAKAQEEADLLLYWIQSKKIFANCHPANITYQFPKPWLVEAQGKDGCWHIPFEGRKSPIINTLPEHWLCVRSRSAGQ